MNGVMNLLAPLIAFILEAFLLYRIAVDRQRWTSFGDEMNRDRLGAPGWEGAPPCDHCVVRASSQRCNDF